MEPMKLTVGRGAVDGWKPHHEDSRNHHKCGRGRKRGLTQRLTLGVSDPLL